MFALLLAATLAASRGPSSSADPYVVPIAPGATTISILTAGDAPNPPYRMIGVPDGLGAFDNGDGTFTVLMNHELTGTAGGVHAHGARGAFVSKWTIRRSDLAVLRGEDLIRQIALWNPSTNSYEPPAKGVVLANLCSASYDRTTGIFFSGEENFEGRVFAHLLDGTSYELPRFGHAQWENAVMHPTAHKTIVVALDDINGGHVYVYIGEKKSSGSPIERAGLTSGVLFVVSVTGFINENPDSGIPSGSAFRLMNLGNVSGISGATQRAFSAAVGATRWQRTEDGAWDPTHPRDFFFVTTATIDGRSRLWRLRFDDLENPAAGGTLDMLLVGTEGPKMMDNIAVRAQGDVILQEDPGAPRLARLWRYDPITDHVDVIAEHDVALFGAASSGEESSGVIDASDILGDGWLLFDVQPHFALPGELVQGGQLLAMHLPLPRRRAVRH